MPTFCGDLDLEHESETMLGRGRKMPGDLISSKRDAPILRESVTGSPPISFFLSVDEDGIVSADRIPFAAVHVSSVARSCGLTVV